MRFFLIQTILTSLIVSLFSGCKQSRKSSGEATESAKTSAPIPYDLTKPAERYDLTGDLTEVSGLSYYKPGRLALIQDELAVVFIFDLNRKRVVDEQIFGRKGDYEGVEFVNGELYTLRSDGEIYHFTPSDGSIKTLGGGGAQVRHIKIGLPGKNDVEGLGYDPKLKALLLATKDAAGGSDRPIYYYGLEYGTMYKGPVLKQADLRAFAGEGGSAGDVKPSGIAVHPKTGEYYILASVGHRLIVTKPNGTILSSVGLNKQLFRQPEGICFAPDGTLFIASEGGKNENGYLLRFTAR
ncbi:hypothetical protein DYU11_15835 [Fibrisoma montanum]|uniref:SdiA-regulated family protein n=1 Tax=Fibrisoma montanum TaxID=2305895 RepID=A0A418M8R4_9BACT|nr:SdiA-regulated domain-containing protein [Fibrisoma montanum]RIV22486.1 hypothetical protein DYU11_15835 [Fibrisoma montanum]